jgi:hypothetical protein
MATLYVKKRQINRLILKAKIATTSKYRYIEIKQFRPFYRYRNLISQVFRFGQFSIDGDMTTISLNSMHRH